jgi:uncharacterized protein
VNAAIGPAQGDAPVAWNTYIAVDDADVAAATVDPGIRGRQEDISAPPGFADAIGWLAPLANGHDHWHVTFTVASRDDSAQTAEKLGAVVISCAELTLSQFTPPNP